MAQTKEPLTKAINGAECIGPLNNEPKTKRSHLFQPGNKFGKGRPKGSRNKVSEAFLRDLYSVWEEEIELGDGEKVHTGRAVIRRVATTEPAKLLSAMVSVLPKDFQVSLQDEGHRFVINAQSAYPSITDWREQHGLEDKRKPPIEGG